MRMLDGYLSRRAQARLDPSSLVYREADDTYVLERAGHPPLALGTDFGNARQALDALAQAARSTTT